ncbi:DUF308 domain-containing protein [Methanobrevibacter sp.]|uniref:DUF308 domain-containing protein n=1 Tax=Methanobrevibacter sp. TaxID=66852 RepID=UPI002E75AFBB|nr:DUF308 domain-containing protein [Methanobrevibacter sp.]MEE0939387.1 DUF308 domain-containing protein [Methanobrevibacter sp.]
MDYRKILGFLFIILGLLFMIYPVYSAEAVSLIAGISLIAFGIASIIDGFSIFSMMTHFSAVNILLGICAILLGVLFIYEIDALSFIIGFQFYLIAFVLMFIGIVGMFKGIESLSRLASVLILILGIIAVFLASFSIAQPLYTAIIVGICLILYGITFLASSITEN